MNQVRELVFYRNHFHDFFDKQSEKAKEKIDYVLFNGYQKKSNKTSSQQIELANKLMKEYFSTTK
ncbi:MAG: hypothetical protein RI982_1087 [Bacteroidota bacterium]|jgi:phage-related protein